MKKILCVAAGLLSTVLASAIVVVVAIYTSFEFQSFGFFFVIPVGSIFIGFAAAAGYALTAKITNEKVGALDYILAALLGLLSAFAVYFLLYKFTFIDPNGNIVYSLEQGGNTPLEEMELEDGTRADFIPYTLMSINERQITFSYRGRQGITTPSNSIIGWIDFSIELLGYLIGALAALASMVSTKYCDNCKKYYKKKKWLEADAKNEDTIKRIDEAIRNRSNVQQVLASIPASSGKINMVFEGESCIQCGDGIFRVSFNILQNDGNRKDLDKLTQEIQLKNNVPLKTDFSLQQIVGRLN